MKKQFNVLVVSIAIVGLTLSLSGVLVSQAAPIEKQQGPNREVPKPIPAANIEVVKKVFLSEEMGQAKGRHSSPPGKDKTKESGAATGVLGEPLAEGASKYAVVIGICDYPGEDYDLCKSDGDSLHMYKALTTLYGYDPANIRLFKDMGNTTYFEENPDDEVPNITAEVPTRQNILNAIMMIKDKEILGDEVVFFFSGHGARGEVEDISNEDINEAILVHDSDGIMDEDGSLELDFIWDEELRILFSDFETTRIAFVFDTCLAGGQNDVVDAGRIVSMATGETQSAYVYSTAGEDVDGDGIKDGEGVFSRYFVNEGMLRGLADVFDHNKNGLNDDVVVEEAFDYAKDNIPPYLKRRQKPVISDQFTADDYTKDLLL